MGTPFTAVVDIEVLGAWSLETSRAFWEGFAPAALAAQSETSDLRTTFLSERDWAPVEAAITQREGTARVSVTGRGDLDAAAAQVARFLSIDIDASRWPDVGRRDPVIGAAQ